MIDNKQKYFENMVAVVFMVRIGVADPHLNAFVPTGGYLLSTLSLPIVKTWWVSKYTNIETEE